MKTSHIKAIAFCFIFFFVCTHSYALMGPETIFNGGFRLVPEWNNVQRKCSWKYLYYRSVSKQRPLLNNFPEEERNKTWKWFLIIGLIVCVIEAIFKGIFDSKK